jgi:pimeloyl-ACP methyl ester carboxylesterase
MAERFLISVHGVETDGAWQERIDPSFEGIDGFAYRKHRYGRFRFWKAALAPSRDDEVERFANLYDELVKEYPQPVSVIAHSFGTYIVGTALLRFPSIHLDAIVLCGSILAADFDWPALFAAKRVRRVLNERAGDDWVVRKFRRRFAKMLVAHSGPTGVDGFMHKPPLFQERLNPQFKHSDHFILVHHCNRFWRPFIFNNEEFAAVSWDYLEGDKKAAKLFHAKYGGLVRKLLKQFLAGKGVGAVAEQTILDAMAKDGIKGIYTPRTLAVAKVSALAAALEEQGSIG